MSSPCCCGGSSRCRGRFPYWLRDSVCSAKLLFVRPGGSTGRMQTAPRVRTSTSPFLPVAIVDDASAKRSLQLSAVPVVGTIDQLVAVVTLVRTSAVLIATPSADNHPVSDRNRRVDRQRDLPPAGKVRTVGLADARQRRERPALDTTVNQGRALLEDSAVILGDIHDAAPMDEVFALPVPTAWIASSMSARTRKRTRPVCSDGPSASPSG
jgi:hypothetical protein